LARLVTADSTHLATELGALHRLAKPNDARSAQHARANKKAVRFAVQRDVIEPDTVRPGERSETDIELPSCNGANDLAVRWQDCGARVHRVRVEAMPAQFRVERGSNAGRLGTARQALLSDLAQAANTNTPAESEPNFPVDQLNEGETLVRQRRRNFFPMAARGNHVAPLQKFQPFAAIRLDVAEERSTARQSCKKEFDRKVPVGRYKGHEIGTRFRGARRYVASNLRLAVGRDSAGPAQDFGDQEPPLAPNAVGRKTAAQEAVDVLGVDAQQASDVAGGEQGVRLVQIVTRERRAGAFHRRLLLVVKCNILATTFPER
jgi:hypothetical protein